jgi:hypothetical protein
LFANRNFGPYLVGDIDYGSLRLPNVEAICGGEGMWLYQSVLLGSRNDMDDVARAIEKVYANRDALKQSEQTPAGAAR